MKKFGYNYGEPLYKKYAPYIKSAFIILVGIAVALFSVSYLTDWVKQNQETVTVPVPAHRINAGQVIQVGDLTAKKLVKAALEPDIAANTAEVVGKVSVLDLLPGEPVMKAKLIPPEGSMRSDEAMVAVRIDQLESALGGTVKPNMLVDVIYIADKDRPPVIMAEKASVMSVLAEGGSTVNVPQTGLTGLAEGGQQLRYVVLKVKRNESFEFVRPLTGGHVLLAHVGYAAAGEVPTQPEPEDQPVEPQDAQNTTVLPAETRH